MNPLSKINEFFNHLDDITADYIDRVEIDPIRISATLYVTGFRRIAFTSFATEVHIKEMRRVKVDEKNTTVETDNGWILMEADNELWMPTVLFDEHTLDTMFLKFSEKFNGLKSFHILNIQYTHKDKEMTRCDTILFTTKRAACKEALAYRKIYTNVKNKFEEFQMDKNGEFSETKQLTDFEIATAAATTTT